METPKGLILILHSGFKKIAVTECLDALPKTWLNLDRKIFEIEYSEKINLPDLYDMAFNQNAYEHRLQFAEKIKPALAEFSDYTVVYFGLAAIPLAIDLGQHFHNHHNVEVFQWSHQEITAHDGQVITDEDKKKRWHRYIEAPKKKNKIVSNGLLQKDQKGIVSALIRVSASHPVHPEDTASIVENASELEVGFEYPNEDAITSPEVMNNIADAVKEAIDNISDNRSKINVIHLFASVPCGLAFMIGNKISPNIHPLIQTYQYKSTATPKYKEALLIKGEISPQRKLTDNDREEAEKCRIWAQEELQRIIECYYPHNTEMSSGRPWYLGVAPTKGNIAPDRMWQELPAICDTSLNKDVVDMEATDVAGGFRREKNKWSFDDGFFLSLHNRLEQEERIRQAIRLFLFHEILHQDVHGLDFSSGINIGSFPKVVEEADYQADVYGMLNEYAFQAACNEKVKDVRDFFLDLIEIATETMWSFDDLGEELKEVQIRRLNRYLIWYRQYVRIEKVDTLTDIVKLLWEKPVIEFNGLITKEASNRFYFILARRPNYPLEIAVFDSNQVKRVGTTTAIDFEKFLQGIKNMDSEVLINAMRF